MAKSWTACQYETLATRKCEPEVPKASIIQVVLGLYAQPIAEFVASRELLFSLPYEMLLDVLTDALVQYIQFSHIQRFLPHTKWRHKGCLCPLWCFNF